MAFKIITVYLPTCIKHTFRKAKTTMRKLHLLTLLFLYPIFSANAYEAKDTIWAIQILSEINKKLDKSDYDGMLLSINKILPVFEAFAQSNVKHYADCYVDLGFYYEYKGDYKTSLEKFKKALEIYFSYSGNYTSKIAKNYDYIGWIYGKLDDIDEANFYLEKAIKIIKEIDGDPRGVLTSLGSISEKKGDFKKALSYYEKALSFQLTQTNKEPVGIYHENVGVCHMNLTNYSRALEYFEKAEIIYKKTLADDNAYFSDLYDNMGFCYLEMKPANLKKAEFYLQLALKNALTNYSENHPYLTEIYNSLSKTFLKQNRIEEAKEFAIKEIKANKISYGAKSQYISSGELMIAYCYEKEGKLFLANQAYEKALSFFPKNENGNIISEKVIGMNKFVLLDIFAGYAKFLEKETFDTSQNKLIKSKELLDQAIRLMDFMLASFDVGASKRSLIQEYFFIFENSIRINNKLWELTEEEQYLENAFQLAIKSKNILLREELRNNDIESFVKIPDQIIQKESAFKNNIANLEKQCFLEEEKENPNTEIISKLKNECFDLQVEYDSLIKKISADYPGYFRLKYKTELLAINEIQKEILTTDQSLIEYFVGDSTIFIFVLDQDDLLIRAVPNDFQLSQLVKDFRLSFVHHGSFAISDSLYEQYIYTATQLYQKLIQPIAPYLKEKLIIIPDGVIGYIPFEALLTKRPDDVMEFRSYPYLITQKVISYTYAMNLLKVQKNKVNTIAQKNLIAFAPKFKGVEEQLSFVTRQEVLSNLKYNRQEIFAINKWIKGELVTNEDATKENFLKLAPLYKIIHLATHGQANDKRGEYSFLAFSAANDSMDLLYASDLYNIDLPAELLVLSACETGVGELKRGEGILSLARGFSFAGVKSILTTLWNVSDKKAGKLMALFYKNISKGLKKDDALRQAKLEYIATSSEREAAPFYWASYIAMGNMEAVELFPEVEQSFFLWKSFIGLCIVGLALGFYCWREGLFGKAS